MTAAAPVPAAVPATASTVPIQALTLNWKAPVANAPPAPPTPLTPLSGYGIWQGATAATMTLVATVAPTVLTWTSPLLQAGHYAFGIEAIAADGSDSKMSNTVAATIQAPAVPGAPTSLTITGTV